MFGHDLLFIPEALFQYRHSLPVVRSSERQPRDGIEGRALQQRPKIVEFHYVREGRVVMNGCLV